MPTAQKQPNREELEKLITEKTVLISLIMVNNEIGSIQPVSGVAHVVETERAKRRFEGNELPLLLHTDATQAANYFDITMLIFRSNL